MALIVTVAQITKLESKNDRFVTVFFRGIPHDTQVAKNCKGDVGFHEELSWPLSSNIVSEEFLEVRLFNKSSFFSDKLVALYRCYLSSLKENQEIEFTDNLVDTYNRSIESELTLILRYEPPSESDSYEVDIPLDDLDTDNVVTNDFLDLPRGIDANLIKRPSSIVIAPSSVSSNGSPRQPRKDISTGIRDREAFHPRIRLPKTVNANYCEWQVQVKVIEAKDLNGMAISPHVDIHVGDQKKHTTTKSNNNNPLWDEFFVFDFKLPKEQMLDYIIQFQVYDGRSTLISQGNLIGQFKMDLWLVYEQPGHSYFSKWAVLCGPLPTEIKGYLRVDISVFGKGAHAKTPLQKKECDVETNLLLPPGIQALRPPAKYSVRIYKAKGIPRITSTLLSNVKKAITGKVRDLADPCVEVSFAGLKKKTKTVKNSYEPEFNQEIIFSEFLPPMCRRIKIQLKDGDDTIGTHYLNLNEISDMQTTNEASGFLPCFGPSWINLYGSTRDYSFFGENNERINEGIGEGMSYRGSILVEVKSSEYEECENGVVEIKDLKNPNIKMPDEKRFRLFACFFEAAMLERKVGERPVQFELSIGEHGFHAEESPKDTRSNSRGSNKSEEDVRLLPDEEDGDDDHFTLTELIKPVSPEKRYCHCPWDDRKPCLSLKFQHEDQTTRHYYQNFLQKLCYRLEDNLDELAEKVRLGVQTKHIILKIFQEIISDSTTLSEYIEDGKHELDKELAIARMEIIKEIMSDAHEKRKYVRDDSKVEIVDEMKQKFLKKFEKLKAEPQHGFPDVFIWLLSGGKRIAYARVPAGEVLFSKDGQKSGLNCGRVQTLFLKHANKRSSSSNGWHVQPKLSVILWLGLEKHVNKAFQNVPRGYHKGKERNVKDAMKLIQQGNYEETDMPSLEIPRSIYYEETHRFILRAHIFQARSLIGSDKSGLSDAFARVICNYKIRETRVIWKTRSPTWDQMLKFKDISVCGLPDEFYSNPPVVVIEIFDRDPNDKNEFLGRALANPVVKIGSQPYEEPFFPPVLQWFPIYRGDEKGGELLAAFELLEVIDDEASNNLPYDPAPLKDKYIPIPKEIKPMTKKYRVEVLFWGVREMKRAKYLHILRPQVEIDCCYKIRQIDLAKRQLSTEDDQSLKSKVCRNAKFNPNFEDPVAVFDVHLPKKDLYIPPITIRVTDCRPFGRKVMAGTCVLESLSKYKMDKCEYLKYIENEQPTNGLKPVHGNLNGDAQRQSSSTIDISETKNKKKKVQARGEDVIDWWARFHATQRQISGEQTSEAGKDHDKDEISTFTMYSCELEKVEKFNGFTDVAETFPLSTGKQESDEDDDEMIGYNRLSGKFKGAIRVWEVESLPARYEEPSKFETTFKEQKRPRYDPIRVLVRVYCIRGRGLKPSDPNGKADPYLCLSLGKHKVNDKKNLVKRQLNPEFGRMFEFEAELPFDNLLTIQVKDWDMFTMDDFIGETKIDIENRYYSKHRPRCGLADKYSLYGAGKWRDSMRPTQILAELCKREGIDPPICSEGRCEVDGRIFHADKEIFNERGTSIYSPEPAALKALKQFHTLNRGYHLVPEHTETRALFSRDKPGLEQGSLEIWIDMFPLEGPTPGPPIDIAPRKPEEFELRVIVWNTDHIPPADTNVITGIPSSDIYLRGWLEGSIDDTQKTDVHYRSTDGNGMFNWRFVFPFMYQRAEEKIATKKKASFFGIDEWIETHRPLLHIQVLDADVFSSDDLIGDVLFDLTKIPGPMKASKLCTLDNFDKPENSNSLIKIKTMRGWWAVKGCTDEDEPTKKGEVELEFELLGKAEADAAPAGRGRDEPQPLDKPQRPADSLNLFMSPLKMIQLLLFSHKQCILKFLVIVLLLLLAALFFYAMPGYTVKKLFNV